MLFLKLYYVLFGFIYFISSSSIITGDILDAIKERQEVLKSIALSTPKNCSGKMAFSVSLPYGRTGNNWRTIANGLWLTTLMNGTFMLPLWTKTRLFDFFHLSLFNQSFCITLGFREAHKFDLHQFIGEDMYTVNKLYWQCNLRNITLPPLNDATMKNIEIIHLRFYASLWATPGQNIMQDSNEIISKYLGNNLNYISIHQRSLEGECANFYCKRTNISYFLSTDIPVEKSEWKLVKSWEAGSFPKECVNITYHPLCNMDPNTVINIIEKKRYNLNNQTFLHLGTDQKESLNNDLVQHLHAIVPSHNYTLKMKNNYLKTLRYSFLDLHLFIHSHLFIQNPLSTFSGLVCTVREMLKLSSVPMLEDNLLPLHERLPNEWTAPCSVAREIMKERIFG